MLRWQRNIRDGWSELVMLRWQRNIRDGGGELVMLRWQRNIRDGFSRKEKGTCPKIRDTISYLPIGHFPPLHAFSFYTPR